MFWHDPWCEVGPLKVEFPRLFAISSQQDLFISQMGFWLDGTWEWNFIWRRVLFAWESEEVARLNTTIGQRIPVRDVVDHVYWRGSNCGVYPIKSIVDKVYNSTEPILNRPIIRSIWQKCAPPRAQLTIWLATLEKLKTGDILVEKGIIDSQQALCPFCSLEMESNSHILFTCHFSWSTWMKMLEWWGITGVFHNRCAPFLTQWGGLLKGKKMKDLWHLTLGCVIWSL